MPIKPIMPTPITPIPPKIRIFAAQTNPSNTT